MQRIRKGFTVIEIVIVIGVLALLSGAYYVNQKGKTKTTTIDTTAVTTTPVSTTTSQTTTTTTTEPAPVKDETADWKTYTNTKHGFSFKYPKEYQAPEEAGIGGGKGAETSDSLVQYLESNNKFRTDKDTYVIESVIGQGASSSLDNFVKDSIKGNYSVSNTTIGGKDARKVSFVSGAYDIKNWGSAVTENRDIIFVKNSSYIILIELFPGENKSNGNKKITEVLSTFKFNK